MNDHWIEHAYARARERYTGLGVDAAAALSLLKRISISLHCWQGDDVGGFENPGGAPGGGLAVTGSHPGKARNADELRADLEKAFSLIPGGHRLNLHAFYGEMGAQRVDRDAITSDHFRNWIAWAKAQGLGLDFNPTFFAHPKAADGFTLAHRDPGIREFWIEHGIRCREIGAAIGQALGSPCVTNVWIPDGFKDTPADRRGPRERLVESLDAIFKKRFSRKLIRDAVESKLFGLGSESYVAGSHELYLGYAITRKKMLCLDAGHFHPTEGVADKLSSVFLWVDEILLHVSRGVRWDSDHVVTLTDELQSIAQELVRGGYLERTRLGLDYFDASINRVAAWVIGARNLLKALLLALLEPAETLRDFEAGGDYTSRLVMLEELKTMPAGAVWDYYCLESGAPVGEAWLRVVKDYEREVQLKRV
jgi:L-rhamnose isomerase